MHAELLTIASQAEVEGGLLSMTGGGWEYVRVDWFPAEIRLFLVGVIVHAPEDYGHEHVISVAAQGSDGRAADFGTFRVAPSTAAAVVKTPFAYAMSLTLEGPVVLSLTATVEGGPTFGPTQFEVRAPT